MAKKMGLKAVATGLWEMFQTLAVGTDCPNLNSILSFFSLRD